MKNEAKKKLLYLYEVKNVTGDTIVLSQSFDNGWKAYSFNNSSLLHLAFPFFGGEKITDHVKINNWANGWNLQDSTRNNKVIVVVYAPQYLQYLGFFILIITFGVFLIPLFGSKYQKYSKLMNQKNIVLKNRLRSKMNLR